MSTTIRVNRLILLDPMVVFAISRGTETLPRSL